MKFKSDFFKRYLKVAPLPLAIERYWECDIQSSQEFKRPILDIGCGEGIFALGLMDEKIELGIDPNAKELERAKDTGMYNELIECYGNAIPKQDEEFQTIFSNSVVEHIEDPDSVLKEAHRLLKSDGVIHLTLPTDKFDQYNWGNQILTTLGLESLANKYRKFFNQFWRHYHYYSKDDWEVIFNRCGLKIEEHFEYGSKAQCLFNNFGSPLCIFSFIVKKLTNRWFLFPSLRKEIIKIIHIPVFSKFAKLKKLPTGKGGLIYFKLVKLHDEKH